MISPLFAGMPSIGPMLSSFGMKTVTGLSTVAAVTFIAAIVVCLSWNALAKSTTLPAISFGKATLLTVLFGLLFFLVLVIISGSRELLTPGAWQPSGLVSHLASSVPSPRGEGKGEGVNAPDSLTLIPKNESFESLQAVRKESLVRLRTALWNYADDHDGAFPESIAASGFPEEFWTIPVSGGRRYDYDPKDEILVRSADLSLNAQGRLVP